MLTCEQMQGMGFVRDPAFACADADCGWRHAETGLQVYGTPCSVGELLDAVVRVGSDLGAYRGRMGIKPFTPDCILKQAAVFFGEKYSKKT